MTAAVLDNSRPAAINTFKAEHLKAGVFSSRRALGSAALL
jgi:hypothetical protein